MSDFSIDVSATGVAFLALPLGGGANSTLFTFPFELILDLGGSCKNFFCIPHLASSVNLLCGHGKRSKPVN